MSLWMYLVARFREDDDDDGWQCTVCSSPTGTSTLNGMFGAKEKEENGSSAVIVLLRDQVGVVLLGEQGNCRPQRRRRKWLFFVLSSVRG